MYSSNEYSWLICLDTMTTTNVWHTQHILIISSRVVKLVATVWAIIYQHIGLLRSQKLFGPKTLKIKVLTQCLLGLISSCLNTNKYQKWSKRCNARDRSWFVHIVSFVLWSVIHQMHYKPQKVKLQNDESSCTTKTLFLQLHTKFSKHIEILTEDTFQTKTFLFILSYIFPSCNTKCIWLKVGVGDGPLT